jgi:hypothetical protein
LIGFQDGISTFTCNQDGDDYKRVDYLLFYPLFGVSLSSRDVQKCSFENPVIAFSWKVVVFKSTFSNSWELCG